MIQSNYMAITATPIGKLGIKLSNDKLIGIDFLTQSAPNQPAKTALASQVVKELQAYFTDPTDRFNVPLNLIGTPFQQKVWQLLANLKVGETLTYGQCAHRLNTSPRAIGNACRQNPIPIIIPCHRIVSQSGLGGYSGETSGDNISMKQWLLTHEKNLRAIMSQHINYLGLHNCT